MLLRNLGKIPYQPGKGENTHPVIMAIINRYLAEQSNCYIIYRSCPNIFIIFEPRFHTKKREKTVNS